MSHERYDEQPDAKLGPDPVEDLLAECLHLPQERLELAVERLCELHPDHADDLRERLRLLRAMGMVGGRAEAAASAGGFPDRLGPFRLLRRLGGGGMGVVYLAEQEPLGRTVALKLIRPEHLYFAGALRRFVREIEVVASLDHPGIVRIHAAGEEQGIPYYAMERVDGRSLAEVVEALSDDAAPPAAASRLGLAHARTWEEACCEIALQVAEALEHAHRRDIVHRDVKPSNVMVTADGRAMLLDFGLASREGSVRLTRSGSQPGSLAYMSPEQLAGTPVDARTDVYSLGVTMYELLAGRSAFASNSAEETRRAIMRAGSAPVTSLDGRLSRDVETICATAMAPEPGRRYQSAAALGADLRAYLERRPIAARRAGPLLRARRFVQRRPAISVALVLAAVVSVGLPFALWLHERGARVRIAREAEVARRVTEFMIDLFEETDPERARGEVVTARAALDRGVRRIATDLGELPYVRAELQRAMGLAYLALGLMREAEPLLRDALRSSEQQGDAADARVRHELALGLLCRHLGEFDEAERLQFRALDVLRATHRDDDPRVAQCKWMLAVTLRSAGRFGEARRLLDESVVALRHSGPAHRGALFSVLFELSNFLAEHAHYRNAAPVVQELVALADELFPGDHPRRVLALEAAGLQLGREGDLRGARVMLERALRMAEVVFDAGHPRLCEVRENYASVLDGKAYLAEASGLLREALAQHRRNYPAQHPTLARALFRQSTLYLELGDLSASQQAIEEAASICDGAFPDGHIQQVQVLLQSAHVACHAGRLEEAVDHARRALSMFEGLKHPRRAVYGDGLRVLALALASQGPSEEAERLAREAVAVLGEWFGDDNEHVAHARSVLAFSMLARGNSSPALEEAERAAALWRQVTAGPHWGSAFARYLIGWALLEQGALEPAEAETRAALSMYEQVHPADHPLLAFPLNNLGVALAQQRRLDDASVVLERALALRRGALPAGADVLAISLLNLAATRKLQGRTDDAESLASECLEQLPAGSPRAGTCVDLLRRLLAGRNADGAELARLLGRARQLLTADDPHVQELLRLIELGR